MARTSPLTEFCNQVRVKALVDIADGELLRRFIASGDNVAFAALVDRHGAMVSGVCARLLDDQHLADDVVQATFLVLARKALTIRRRERLASWLHGVAHRLARQARLAEAARTRHEHQAANARGKKNASDPAWDEMLQMLDDELSALPERYRTPLLLCYWESRSQERAAKQIGVSQSTLSRQLERGRELLRARLVRRGVSLGAGLSAGFLAPTAARAILSAELRQAVMNVATAGPGATIPATVLVLASGGVRMTLLMKACMAAVVVAGITTAGIGWQTRAGMNGGEQKAKASRELIIAQAKDKQTDKREEKEAVRIDQLGDPLPEGAVMRLGTTRLFMRDVVKEMTFTPDGKILLTGGHNYRRIRTWNTTTGKELPERPLTAENVFAFALSPNGAFLVTAPSDPTKASLKVWDFMTGKLTREIAANLGNFYEIVYSRSGNHLATRSKGAIHIWDTSTWNEVRRFVIDANTGGISFLGHDNTLIAATALDGKTATLRWLDVHNGEEIQHLTLPFTSPYQMEVSRDGKRLALCDVQKAILLLDAESGKRISELKTGDFDVSHGNWNICFSPDSKTLACSGGDSKKSGYSTIFLDTNTGNELSRWREVHQVGRVTYLPDGKSFAQVSQVSGSIIKFRDCSTGVEIHTLPRLPRDVAGVRFTPDDKTLIASVMGGVTYFADSHTGKQSRPPTPAPRGFSGISTSIYETALTLDARKAATLDANSIVQIWEPATAKVLAQIVTPAPMPDMPPSFFSDGKTLAIMHADEVLRLWDIEKQEIRLSIPLKTKRTVLGNMGHWHVVSPNQNLIATALSFSSNRSVRVWETETGKELVELVWKDNSSCRPIGFTTDGKFWSCPATVVRAPVLS